MGKSPQLKLGQEWAWDYPRPGRVEPVPQNIRVEFASQTTADTTRAHRVLEASHLPTYYRPREDIREEYLRPSQLSSLFEYKRRASYVSLEVNGQRSEEAGWAYPIPSPNFAVLRDAIVFCSSCGDACYAGDEGVEPQEGDFYGGWCTSNIVGPFKGGPGTWGW